MRGLISRLRRTRRLPAAAGAVLLLGLPGGVAGQPTPADDPGFYAPFAPGLLARPVTRQPMREEAGVELEVWDLLVGPGIVTDALVLPGGGVLQVRSGAAQLTLDGQPQDVRIGQSVALDEGRSLRIDNRGSSNPLTLRATLVRAR